MQSLHLEQLQTLTEHPNQAVGLWLPSEKFSVLEVAAPSAPKRKWPALLPWLLEDQLLEPVEQLHFTVVDNEKGRLTVLVIARRELDAVMEQAEGFNLDVLKMQPDFLALPWQEPEHDQPGKIVLAWRLSGNSRVLMVRHGRNQGFAVPESMAGLLLNRLIAEQSTDGGQLPELHACMPEEALPDFLRGQPVNCGPAPDWLLPMTSPVNLLHGDYALTNENSSLRHWWLSAALVALALGLAWGWLKVDTGKLSVQLAAHEEARDRQFSRLFPGVRVNGSIQDTLETLQNDRFRQGEKLREPVPGLMQLLDVVLSECNCGIESIDLNQAGGTLLFSSPPPRISAFDNLYGISATSSQDDSGQTTITLQRSSQ